MDWARATAEMVVRRVIREAGSESATPSDDSLFPLDPLAVARIFDIQVEGVGSLGLDPKGHEVWAKAFPREKQIKYRLPDDKEPGEIVRWRYTMAHELGHVMLHGELAMGRGMPPSGNRPLYRSERKPRRWDSLELDANTFAACVLMPTDQFRHAFRTRFGADAVAAARIFSLCGETPPTRILHEGSREGYVIAARELAASVSPRGEHPPLTEKFGVGRTACGRRIGEIQAVLG